MARIERIDPIAALWRGFRQPWLLLILGAFAILLILGALAVPQIPPEIAFDMQATTRWLISTSADYGAVGQIMLNIGLFDVIHSLLLRIIFGLIALVLAVHLGHLLGVLFHTMKIPGLLNQPTANVAEPLIQSTPDSLFQMRDSLSAPPSVIGGELEAHLQKSYAQVKRLQVEMPAEKDAEVPALDTQEQSDPLDDSIESGPVVQERFLAQTSLLPNLLRPLLMLGLITALIPLWLITTTGWELYPPPLAPGQQITFESQGLDLRYITQSSAILEEAARQNAYPAPRTLEIRLGEETTTLPIPIAEQDENGAVSVSSASARLEQVDIDTYPGPPGLLISTLNGQEDLVLPASSEQLSSVGLVFPGVGNEKAVLLPRQGHVLRIVRKNDENQIGYLIEVIDRDGNPIGDTRQIEGVGTSIVNLETAETSLRFDAVPGVIVEAKYLPGLWLMFVALGLVVIGAIGYWMRTGYVLLQLAPWPEDRTIAIAQSDRRSEIDAIKALAQSSGNPVAES